MKRVFAVLACSLFLAACGSGSSDGNETDSSSQASGQSENASRQTSQTKSGSGTVAHTSEGKNGFKSERAKQSYALGVNVGNSVKRMPIEVNVDLFIAGIKDELGPGDTRLTAKQVRQEVSSLISELRTRLKQEREQKAAANLEQSREFLARNKKKPGVKTTASGLQYKVLEKGNGPVPDANDVVTVSYMGKLPNGKVFDATKPGETAKFPVNAVIAGWTEALQMMHEGAKYKLFIPPDLAYGKRGAGRLIGPNQVLIFTVTLENVRSIENDGQAAASGEG